jgi:F420-dependent oxidoreductase-like protein
MIEIAIMVEGQMGLNWPRWQRLAKAVEDLGFAGLFRSDHYTNPSKPDQDSLELWVSLSWLAANTSRIAFGPLVTPFSFREPTMTARMAAAVDDLSNGRLVLGLGAGWQAREHHNYGHQLLDIPGRMKRFEEGLEVVTRLLNSDEPVEFSGEHYFLEDAILLPRPKRKGGPPILIGGNGMRRTLPLAARYASEWNGTGLTPEQFAERSARLDELLEAEDREKSAVQRSIMTGCEYGRDDKEAKRLATQRSSATVKDLQDRGVVAGTANQIVEQLGRLAEAGVDRMMLQWIQLDDIDRLESMAKQVLPQMHS